MIEKRFNYNVDRNCIEENGEFLATINDGNTIADKLNELNEERDYFERKKCEYFNKYNKKHLDNIQLKEENKQLKELLELISIASSFTKEESVKEILRHEIKAIDTVTEDSAMAWHDYCVLSDFFKKQYGEHWDNE